jgi:hypothetical protein
MSEANAIPSPVEQPKTEATPGAALDWGIGPLLDAQAEILAGAEATVTDWLRRRREAILDTRQLIGRVRVGGDLTETFQAQRDWISRSFERLAADTDAYQSVARQVMDRAPGLFSQAPWLAEGSWFPAGSWFSGTGWFPQSAKSPDASSSQSAATRTGVRPLRMANK